MAERNPKKSFVTSASEVPGKLWKYTTELINNGVQSVKNTFSKKGGRKRKNTKTEKKRKPAQKKAVMKKGLKSVVTKRKTPKLKHEKKNKPIVKKGKKPTTVKQMPKKKKRTTRGGYAAVANFLGGSDSNYSLSGGDTLVGGRFAPFGGDTTNYISSSVA